MISTARARLVISVAALAFFALPVSSALAGRLIVTGHDQDEHCTANGPGPEGGCHFVKVAVDFVRGGAPDPSKPVLVLDRDPSGGTSLEVVTALDNAYGMGVVPTQVVDPRSAQFASLPITTSSFSAIVVASDNTCGGCDLNTNDAGDPNVTPDSDAINARAGDIGNFFNAGGGILAFAGATHGDGDATNGKDDYYGFLPIPLGGKQVQSPFHLTAAGQSLGFEDNTNGIGTNNDINCCLTHNSFQPPPSGSPLQISELDSTIDPNTGNAAPAPETLFASGQIQGGQLTSGGAPPAPTEGVTANVFVDKGTVLVKLPAGKTAKGLAGLAATTGFVPISKIGAQVPFGSTLDTTRGQVRLVTATNKTGGAQTGHFGRGVFIVQQARTNPLTTVSMTGGSLNSCAKLPHGGSPKAVAGARRGRSLFANVHGHFRTRARNSSATVRGTEFLVKDSCSGTLTTVKRGTVIVRDFTLKKNVTVKAHHKYLARPPKRK